MTNKINEIKDTLKKYQITPEYKKKRQFDLYFQGNDDYPTGICYDETCQGIPIGGFLETAAFTMMVEEVRKSLEKK